MPAPYSRRIQRRQLAALGSGAIAAGLGSLSFLTGCTVGSEKSDQARRYRTAGPSMNPTLWGPSWSIDCDSCRVKIHVDESLLRPAMDRFTAGMSSSPLRCWHCGAPITPSQLNAAIDSPGRRPDVVDVIPCATDDLVEGDVLLVGNGGAHVKRLLGRPGQMISIDEAGRLLVDRRRPAFATIPRVAVDWDRLRDSSRWHGSGDATRWQRHAVRHWSAHGNTDWLVYAHENIYHADQPGRILDDYPGNLGVTRSLFPADGLSVRLEVDASRLPRNAKVDIGIVFWTERGLDRQQQTVAAGGENLIEATATRSLPEHGAGRQGIEPAALPPGLFSAQRPVGIQILTAIEGLIEVRNLTVSREVLYRINPHRLRSDVATPWQPPRYPLHLGVDQWFVVGDNVPLSVDSRSWGAIATRQIVGRVDVVGQADA